MELIDLGVIHTAKSTGGSTRQGFNGPSGEQNRVGPIPEGAASYKGNRNPAKGWEENK